MKNQLTSYLTLLAPIPEEDQKQIANAFEPVSVKEGEFLFEGGKVCKTMFFICTGVLRIVLQNEKGNPVTHFFLKENQFCTILNSFNNDLVATESIQAACDAEILSISKIKLLALYDKISYLKNLITQITHQALLDKIQIRNAYLGQDSTTRYRLFMTRQPEIALRVPLSDVASYLGITQQSLSRIRKNIR
jgi:CRP-like cAMP-binding protein